MSDARRGLGFKGADRRARQRRAAAVPREGGLRGVATPIVLRRECPPY